MASISRDKTGKTRIQFVGPDDKRKTIYLGACTKREAEAMQRRVESILSARLQGREPNQDDAIWLGSLADKMHRKLSRVDLVPERETRPVPLLGDWLRDYVASRQDVEASTRVNCLQVVADLEAYFGVDRPMTSIMQTEAQAFRVWMLTDRSAGCLSMSTVNRRCKRARQFFRAALEQGVVEENPFHKVKGGQSINRDRMEFISRDVVDAIMAECPDDEFCLVLALARYGGLRIPSELRELRWSDVDWEKGRIRIQSPKTKHQGKPSREIPLFDELLQPLLNVLAVAEGEEYIVPKYRKQKNLRTPLERAILRAGYERWPKAFQNLRSSRQTELTNDYPAHVVAAWLGNTVDVANKHYLQVTEEHFARAAEKTTQKTTQQIAEMTRNAPKGGSSLPTLIALWARICERIKKGAIHCESHPLTPRRLELRLPG
jgi:integrase